MRSTVAILGLASLFAMIGMWAYLSDSWLAYGVLAAAFIGGGAYAVKRARRAVGGGNERFGGDLPPHVRRALASGKDNARR